jgi:hypothetical protein
MTTAAARVVELATASDDWAGILNAPLSGLVLSIGVLWFVTMSIFVTCQLLPEWFTLRRLRRQGHGTEASYASGCRCSACGDYERRQLRKQGLCRLP